VDAVRIERIDPGRHDRSVFDCGDSAVDGWLRQDAIVADRQQGVVVQVASDGRRVVGCYRLGSFQVQARRPVRSLWSFDLDRMPVPALMVSHLCVDQRLQGRGLGTQLMLHALELAAAVAPAVGARLVVGHGGTERATGFLRRFGFRAFDTDPRWCNLPMQDVEATVSARATPPQTPPPPPLVDQDQTAGPTHRTDDGESDVDLERCVLDCVKTYSGSRFVRPGWRRSQVTARMPAGVGLRVVHLWEALL
jgi:GNAT superfamily N-acetyltransferase